MPNPATTILAHLKIVEGERIRRSTVRGLDAKVAALKAYQQRRFSRTYADLLQSTRHGPAARFFLEELYGPGDFTHRDEQFARVVPALMRLFPTEIADTVAKLSELHALSESLDTQMGVELRGEGVDGNGYLRAWQSTGRAGDRKSQIGLMLDVAERLDRFTRRALLRNSLRLMRGPARAAGLADLQHFLETGFDTFRAMGGAGDFISTVAEREHALASTLFSARLCEETDVSMARALAALP